jgi:soluble P-type ATPase
MPVSKCSNGKWRVGSGACIYETKEKAIKVYQAILASGQLAAQKISMDYDGVLSTDSGKRKLFELVAKGVQVYIVSARQSTDDMNKSLPIPQSRIFATGSNKAKIEKIKELGITTHYDDNEEVIKNLSLIGIKGIKW